ncbi:rod-binding protein [Afifella pfennigii]|uniref:rod-binding protein n=1 Tax=Afifella pfennigii TaxID=209897 RepID=UPI00047CE4CE|nr:rod-binding protein [Afifella pfennigii]
MAISPPSDIVLDVARAADPARYKEATQRLTELRSAGASTATRAEAGEAFDALMRPGSQSAGVSGAARPLLQLPVDSGSAVTRLANSTALTSGTSGTAPPPASAAAYQDFEAMVLTSFVQTMMPSNAPAVFGSGSAGEIWRSMLAEQIARQIADAGGVGIAGQLQREDAEAAPQTAAPDTAGLI